MIYNMILESHDGNQYNYHYNTENNTIIDHTGKFVVDPIENFAKRVFPISPENPGKKSNSIKVLKIQLGLKCNYSCSYCLQSSEIADSIPSNQSDTYKFLEDLTKWMIGSPDRIEFWGGEPFVYWNKLKVLIPKIHNMYPEAILSMITNGSLFDEEKIEFIQKYDISLSISHDGPQQKFRGTDPFKNETMRKHVQSLINARKEKVTFNVVLHSKNYDLTAIHNWFHQRFDNPNLSLEGIVSIYDDYTLRNIGQFTKQQYLELTDNIFYELVEYNNRFHSLSNKLKNFITAIKTQTPIGSLTQRCGMDREDILTVDLAGNVMTCQNTGSKGKHKIGTVYDFDNISLNTSSHFSFREECMHCPLVQLCKGSCMYLNGDYFAQSCWNEYYYNLGVLKAAMFLLTDKILIRIDGDIRRPEYSPESLQKNQNLKELYYIQSDSKA